MMQRAIAAVAAMIWTIVLMGQVALQPGVSHELAQYRARHISNVKYDLELSLSPSQERPVGGQVTVSFDWMGSEDLQLDFQGQLADTALALLNYELCPIRYCDEHIVIPSDRLKQGSNEISLVFSSLDQALNRHADYLYTLFVPDHARSVFPCFDQPDLKARFSLTLSLPEQWQAISNGRLTERQADTDLPGIDIVRFAESDLLPTYLFSFTAGCFDTYTATRDGRDITILYRETDPAKVAQLPQIADEMALSIRWMEQYTGIRQPFAKFGTVVLPGYQFGGMEHPGCIQLNDRTIFLGRTPSTDDHLKRLQLIAHETAHLWFGDLVTMQWFNDVWTKEVFANFMADKVCREQYPELDHDLNFMRSHYIPAVTTDRSLGTHPIQQPLDNLNQAGMLYGNIIYHKAPIMMRKLEECMGEQTLRQGLQTYLRRYAHANATWDGLIDILHAESPTAGIRDFDRRWVKQRGMEVIDVFPRDDEPLANADGRGYARYRLADRDAVMRYVDRWGELTTAEGRLAAVMTLFDNMLMHRIGADDVMPIILRQLQTEPSEQLLSTYVTYAMETLKDAGDTCRPDAERALWQLARRHSSRALRQRLMRSLVQVAQSPAIVDSIYHLWSAQSEPLLNVNDLTRAAWHLAIVRPGEWQSILATQRSRLTTDDQRREFDFVGRACTPDTAAQHQLFVSLLRPANRRVEPHARAMLALLNDPLREPASNRYILPALDALEDVQRTGDIFFPLYWCTALLSGHRSDEARQLVNHFIDRHPGYNPQLLGKLLQAADHLLGN